MILKSLAILQNEVKLLILEKNLIQVKVDTLKMILEMKILQIRKIKALRIKIISRIYLLLKISIIQVPIIKTCYIVSSRKMGKNKTIALLLGVIKNIIKRITAVLTMQNKLAFNITNNLMKKTEN